MYRCRIFWWICANIPHPDGLGSKDAGNADLRLTRNLLPPSPVQSYSINNEQRWLRWNQRVAKQSSFQDSPEGVSISLSTQFICVHFFGQDTCGWKAATLTQPPEKLCPNPLPSRTSTAPPPDCPSLGRLVERPFAGCFPFADHSYFAS